MWARVGQPVSGVVAVSAADRISVSIINYLHQGTYRPGVIFRSGALGPALRRIGEQMIEYTYMPMLVLRRSAAVERIGFCYYARETPCALCPALSTPRCAPSPSPLQNPAKVGTCLSSTQP